jgi:drug/metabolite transporter (DMT)-like permease
MTSTRIPRMTWALLLALGLIWGGSFFFARIAIHHIPPLTLVFLRVFIAALALHLYIGGRYEIYQTLKARAPEFLILGLINNAIPHTLIFAGQTEIGAGLAAILNATTPIWTLIIANFWTTDEKFTQGKIVGCILGFAGTVVLLGPSAFGINTIPVWALVLPVAAAMSYGVAGIYGKRFRGQPAPVTAAGQLTASSLIMLPVALLYDHPWSLAMPPLDAILAVLALALLSTAFGYILYFRIMSLAGATVTSLVTLLVPPSAVLLGYLFLHETLEWTELTGMILIGLGLLAINNTLRFSLKAKA